MAALTHSLASFEEDQKRRQTLRGSMHTDLARQFRAAVRDHGAPPHRMALDCMRLALGPGRLTPHEYFIYRLFERDLPFAHKAAFVGKRMQRVLHHACNKRQWIAIADDKLVFHALMRANGLPVPRMLAVYHPGRRAAEGQSLASPGALRGFLAGLEEPAFAKPVEGIYSLGCIAIEKVDPRTGRVGLAFGGEAALEDVLQRIEASRRDGYVIQERLRPHPELERLFGPALGTIRVLVLLGDSGPELFRAACKIPVGTNVADNFWRGNMLGGVDLDSGAVTRVVGGSGVDQQQHSHHPDTGAPLVGAALPLWSEVKQLCLDAARTIPGLRSQAWDVAITRNGPVLVEVNAGGDVILPQLAHGAGLLDEQYVEHLRRCGYRGRLAAPSRGGQVQLLLQHGLPLGALALN